MITRKERRAKLMAMLASQPDEDIAMTIITEGERAIVSIADRDFGVHEVKLPKDKVPALLEDLCIYDELH